MSIELQKRLRLAEQRLDQVEQEHAEKILAVEKSLIRISGNLDSRVTRAAIRRPPIVPPKMPRVLIDLLRTQ